MNIKLLEKNSPTMGRINLKSMLNLIIIPFSAISGPNIVEDIYKGKERIPFKEKHPVFQIAMLDEFTDC